MMEKLILKRIIPLSFYLVLMVFIPFHNHAQTLKRQCISSYGVLVTFNSSTILQTVGQPYSTIASNKSKSSIFQGFQQPVVFKVETFNTPSMENLSISAYPNPAAYTVTIKSGGIIENSIINVIDGNGKVILSRNVAQLLSHEINCTSWQNGTYIITVSDKKQNKSSLKLTINK